MPFYKNPEPVIVIRGKLVDAKTGKPIGAKIIYERLPDGKEVGKTYSSPETGEYEITLPAGYLYGVRAEAKDYISESQNLDLRNYKEAKTIEDNLKLQPKEVAPVEVTPVQIPTIEVAHVEENASITLNNIFFDFDKSVLKEESFPELDRLVNLMNEKPKMQVEVSGHTDQVGTEEYNMGLSQRRATAVGEYLIKKGIAKARVAIVFFGESNVHFCRPVRCSRAPWFHAH